MHHARRKTRPTRRSTEYNGRSVSVARALNQIPVQTVHRPQQADMDSYSVRKTV